MRRSISRRSLLAAGFAVALSVATAMGAMPVGYSAVTEADLPQMSLNHYFTPAGRPGDQQFAWTFAADGTFEAKAGEGSIPLELRQRLTGSEAEAKQIAGKWKLAEGQIHFSDVKADGKAVAPETPAVYRIYRTAPTVVRIGEPQYVFGIDYSKP